MARNGLESENRKGQPMEADRGKSTQRIINSDKKFYFRDNFKFKFLMKEFSLIVTHFHFPRREYFITK